MSTAPPILGNLNDSNSLSSFNPSPEIPPYLSLKIAHFQMTINYSRLLTQTSLPHKNQSESLRFRNDWPGFSVAMKNPVLQPTVFPGKGLCPGWWHRGTDWHPPLVGLHKGCAVCLPWAGIVPEASWVKSMLLNHSFTTKYT